MVTLRRGLKWVGLCACAITIGLFILGGWYVPKFTICSPGWSFGAEVSSGHLGLLWANSRAQLLGLPETDGLHVGFEARKPGYPRWRWYPWWSFGQIPASPLRLAYVPLHLLLIAFALPTAAIFYFERRARAPSSCAHCDYNRAGLGAGSPCPECGKQPTSPPQS